MQDSLIAQVKRLAEAQGDGAKWVKIEFPKVVWGTIFDFPALLAHLERTQAVVDAARALRQAQIDYDPRESPADVTIKSARLTAATNALDAALENLENNDGK